MIKQRNNRGETEVKCGWNRGQTWVKVGENRCEIGVSIEVKQGWRSVRKKNKPFLGLIFS